MRTVQSRRSKLSALTMPDIAALEKHPCAACGAQAEWNPAKQQLVCPFCGTSRPFSVDAARARSSSSISRKALRELPDEPRGWQTEKRTVQCQSCKAVSVFDPTRVGQNCELLRLAGARRLHGDQGARSGRRACCRSRSPSRRSASRSGDGTRASGSRPAKLKSARARRSRPRRLHSVLDVRRAGRLPVGGRGRPLLLHDRDVPRQQGPHADAPGAARPLGTGVRRRRALLRRRAGAGDARRVARAAEAGRAVSDDRARAVRHGVSLGLRRRALSGRAARRGEALGGVDDREAARACARPRCRATRTATCEIHPTFSAQTFKHILVPVWLLTYLYGAKMYQVVVNGYTGGWRASIRRAPGRSRSSCSLAIIVGVDRADAEQHELTGELG